MDSTLQLLVTSSEVLFWVGRGGAQKKSATMGAEKQWRVECAERWASAHTGLTFPACIGIFGYLSICSGSFRLFLGATGKFHGAPTNQLELAQVKYIPSWLKTWMHSLCHRGGFYACLSHSPVNRLALQGLGNTIVELKMQISEFCRTLPQQPTSETARSQNFFGRLEWTEKKVEPRAF